MKNKDITSEYSETTGKISDRTTEKMYKKTGKIKSFINKIANPVSAKADVKKSHIIQLVIGLAIIILLNIIGNFIFVKFDLTQEKRYSLSKSTKQLLVGGKKGYKKVDDIIMIRCYLDGNIPASYKELRNATRDLLNEMRSYNSNIEFEFIDPNGFKDNKTKSEFYEKLFT